MTRLSFEYKLKPMNHCGLIGFYGYQWRIAVTWELG